MVSAASRRQRSPANVDSGLPALQRSGPLKLKIERYSIRNIEHEHGIQPWS
jgi:hypothetical protein